MVLKNRWLISKLTFGLWLYLLVFSFPAQARDSFTVDRLGTHNLATSAYFLVDSSNQLALDQVLESDQWQRNYQSSLVFGYSDDTYWITMDLIVEQADRWYLVLDYPVLDKVDFYWVKDGRVLEHHQAGDRIPYHARSIYARNFVFAKDMTAGEEITFYIRIKTQGSYQIPLQLKSSQALQNSLSKTEFMLGMFYGVLFIMSIYNLVLYLITGVPSYLYYVAYVATTLISRMAFDGTGFEFLWPHRPDINEWALPLGLLLASISFWLFAYYFLNVSTVHKGVRWSAKVLMGLMLFSSIVMPSFEYTTNIQIQTSMAAFMLVSALFLSMYMTLKGSWYAAIFCIATMLSSIAFVVSLLGVQGKIDSPNVSMFSYAYARVFEVILFAMALGVRIRDVNNMRVKAEKEADEARELSIKNLEQYQRLYESALTGNAVLSDVGCITSKNQAFIKIFSECTREGQDESIYDYFHQDQLIDVLEQSNCKDCIAETEQQDMSGRWIQMLIHKVDMDPEHVYECAFLDVSDRKEGELIKAQAQSDKMASLQTLITGISRELATPLQLVESHSNQTQEILEKLYHTSVEKRLRRDVFLECVETAEDDLSTSNDEVRRLGKMIESFKQVSIQQMSYQSEELNVNDLSQNITRYAENLGVFLELQIKDHRAREFITFPEAIIWIIDELMVNASHHKNNDDCHVACKIFITELEMTVEFKDDGLGVADENIDKIFTPFFSVNEDKDHLGLGLYQVSNLVEQLLKGDIDAKNDQGLRIDMSIPNLRLEHHANHVMPETIRT